MSINLKCPKCGALMVKRTNRKNGSEFYGCSNWPECTHTQAIPEYEKMIEAGAETLPGFED